MIQALDRNSKYLMVGKWIKREDILQKREPDFGTAAGIPFRFRLLSMISQENEYPVRNLTTNGERTAIETLVNIDIRKDDYVLTNNKLWVVEKVYVGEIENQEKSLGLSRLQYSNKRTQIYLVEVPQ